MVIQEESGVLDLPSGLKKTLFESKSYVVHSQNNENMNGNELQISVPFTKSRETPEDESKVQVRISKKRKKSKQPSDNLDNGSNTISTEDLEELRTVYKKCKSIIKKIETKYGHLLDLDENDCQIQKEKNETDDEKHECQCTLNKKIVFDDDGTEIAVDSLPSEHICPKKACYSQLHTTQPSNSVLVDYSNGQIDLPESLEKLKVILQDTSLELTYRNQVIHKMKLIRQEFSNEMRFNKHLIINKLKTNTDDILEFKGSNLSSLSGYVLT